MSVTEQTGINALTVWAYDTGTCSSVMNDCQIQGAGGRRRGVAKHSREETSKRLAVSAGRGQ